MINLRMQSTELCVRFLVVDKTRVCLAGGEEKDYINANHVKVRTLALSYSRVEIHSRVKRTPKKGNCKQLI